jgi:peptidoglycan-associated lipoprotein
MTRAAVRTSTVIVVLALLAACGGNPTPVPNPPPAPSAFPGAGAGNANPAPRPPDPPPVPDEPAVTSSPLLPLNDETIETLNGPNSPLKPVFFAYDSDTLDETAKRVLEANADVLRTYSTWIVTVEGHCDERGTAEYNLALGDRRAMSARNYLVSLGIPANRLRTVSYGKEFPFDTGNNETAWRANRRAHFMLTAK